MGKVTVVGGKVGMEAPLSGILASDLAVGSTVKLMENGSPIEYLVVHQGVPSSMYDSSCDGMWLLRKDIYENRKWHSSNKNNYSESDIHSYLNGTFLGLFDTVTQEAIRQSKIPFVNGTGSSAVASGSSGLSAKVFLLGGYEVGWTKSTDSNFPVDGACLSYFSGTASYDTKRVAYLNGAVAAWWLRSPCTNTTVSAWAVYHTDDGRCGFYGPSNPYGVRPALILPSNAVFDEATLVLKGVK